MSIEGAIENVTVVYTSRGDTLRKRKEKEPVTLLSICKCCYLTKVIYNVPYRYIHSVIQSSVNISEPDFSPNKTL
jgi:hypothetical protein